MRVLLDIALGKSVYTFYFLAIMVAAVVFALVQETAFATDFALVLVCIFGIFIMVTAVATTNEAIESLGWPTANAKLGFCRVSAFGTISEGSDRPSVQYSFEVGGQTYYGNSYILGERTWGRSAVEKMVSDMESRRDAFSISYSPADPSTNVVIPGINSVHFVRALTGIGIVGATVLELCGWINFTST